MTLNNALVIVGSLSEPSKMPCYSWSISAKKCNTGQKLRTVKNSICHDCYALKNRYLFPHVQKCLDTRLEKSNHPLWAEAMACVIKAKDSSGFFRWFDSGDIQSLEMLKNIVKVCNLTPNVKHWLPTREYGIVVNYIDLIGALPSNLTVRFSSYLYNSFVPESITKKTSCVQSSVSKDGYNCPASTQGNKCLTCRLCWDKNVSRVVYKKH